MDAGGELPARLRVALAVKSGMTEKRSLKDGGAGMTNDDFIF